MISLLLVAFQLVALPSVFAFWIWWLYRAGERRRLVVGVLAFCLSLAAGAWTLATSSQAAGVTLLLLPYEAVLAGALGLAFDFGWASKKTSLRIAGRLCLTAAALLIGAQLLVAR